MKTNILATKLHVPVAPPKSVLRERLIQRLNDGVHAGRPLTLVSAPAGFGKSTCVGAWLHDLGWPAAWLSLEPADDDPARFFAYFVAALHSVDPNLGRELEGLLASGQLPPAEAIGDLLLGDLSRFNRSFVLVLDDFQVIQEPAILRPLEKLVAGHPSQLHLVLVTREDPSLPLARLRANNQLTELRAEDLRFNSAETGAFFDLTMGLSLSAEDISRLESRIEGWVAGLQLAGLSLQGRPDRSAFILGLSGTHRHILSYLTEEVLNRQSPALQDFLVETSILDRMTGELCDALTGRADGDVLLERLLAANLFLIALDEDRRWYRYHHLFADLLRSQLDRLPAGRVSQMHRLASEWFGRAGLAPEAIHHALAGADYALAVSLVEQHAMDLAAQGHVRTVEGWLRAIPPAWHSQSPRAHLASASVYLLRGNYAASAQNLDLAEVALFGEEGPAGRDAAEAEALRAEWWAIRANLLNVQGQAAEGLEAAKRSLQAARPDQYYVRGVAYVGLGGAYRLMGDYAALVDAYQKAVQNSRAAGSSIAEMLAINALSLTAIEHGQLHFARQVAADATEQPERSGILPPIAGTVVAMTGLVEYEWNQLDAARRHFEQGIQMNKLGGHNAGIVLATVLLARLTQAEGDMEGAGRLVREAADLMAFGVPAWVKPEVLAQQVRLYLAQNNPVLAEVALKQYPRSVQDVSLHPDEPFFIAYLHLWLHQARSRALLTPSAGAGGARGELDQALAVAEHVVAEARQFQRAGIEVQGLLVRAQLHALLGNPPASQADLTQALRLAQPEDYIRTFVDEGPALAALLKGLQKQNVLPEYVRKLLAAFAADEAASPAQTPEQSGLVEPLSERELEVLGLMSEGLTNPAIAKRLVISLSTVKTHLNNIYGKLSVRNRAEAVLRAKELGLL